MSAGGCQNFNKKSDFQCISVDGASSSSMGLPELDFSNISVIDSAESFLLTTDDPSFVDIFANMKRCSVCHCPKIEDTDQEFSEESSNLEVNTFSEFSKWTCPSCEKVTQEEYERQPDNTVQEECSCAECQRSRDSQPDQSKESSEFRQIFINLDYAISKVYSMHSTHLMTSGLDVNVLRSHVAKLCQQSPHCLFQKLNMQCRLKIINMKIQLLKRPPVEKPIENAYQFVSELLHDYDHVCKACETLALFLSPLVEQYLSQFDATWQLQDKYLFRSVIFTDDVVQKCLANSIGCIRQELLSLQQQEQEEMSNEEKSLVEKYEKALKLQVEQDVEFIKNQRRFLKEAQGSAAAAIPMDETKEIISILNNWSEGHPALCPWCNKDGCSNDEAGMSHLITCGIINPEIVSGDGLSPTSLNKSDQNLFEPDLQEYLNPGSIRSSSSSSRDSYLADEHQKHLDISSINEERRRGDGDEETSIDEEEDDDNEGDEEEDDDFHDAQQIHSPDYSPSIDNSSELVNRGQTFLLQHHYNLYEKYSCPNSGKNLDSLYVLPCAAQCKHQTPLLKLMLKDESNGEEEEEDEDSDIHEEGVHTSGDLECAAAAATLTRADLLLKASHTSFDEYLNSPLFSHNSPLENDHHRFLLPAIEQYWGCNQINNKSKCLRLRMSEKQTSSSLLSNNLVETNSPVLTDCQLSSNLSLADCCATNAHPQSWDSHIKSSPAKIARHLDSVHNNARKLHESIKPIDDTNCCEIKLQRNETLGVCTSDKKSGKDRSTQHPEKTPMPPASDKIFSSSACNYHQVALKHLTPCQQQQQQIKAPVHQKAGSGDNGGVQSLLQQKPSTFALPHPQQPSKQQLQSAQFRCRAPSCNGHLVGAGDGGADKEECEGTLHQHMPSCEVEEKSPNGQKDSNGKPHCECWHCEFFGHETPSSLPMSRNFAECRDRLRQKLKKKQTCEPSSTKVSKVTSKSLNSTSRSSTSNSFAQCSALKSVDELIDFINGGKNNVDQNGKDKRKEAGPKKKSGKNKKAKENLMKPNTSENASSNPLDEKKDNQNKLTGHLQPNLRSNSPSKVCLIPTQKLEAKNSHKSKSSDAESPKQLPQVQPGNHSHLPMSVSVTSSSSSNSSLENSISFLKISCSKKCDVSRSSQTTISYRCVAEKGINERKNHFGKEFTRSNHSTTNLENSPSSSPQVSRSNLADLKAPSPAALNCKPNMKTSITPPSSPQCRSKKVDNNGQKKTPDCSQKQKNSVLKGSSVDTQKFSNSQMNEVCKNGTPPSATPARQNKSFSSTHFNNNSNEPFAKPNVVNCNGVPGKMALSPVQNGGTHLSVSCNINSCNSVDNKNTNHVSSGPSSPPGSSKSKKQKKRNKNDIDLSFEEIFKPNDEEDLGDDDREIEEFKRFCFNTSPLPVREKLKVNLNMKDIFNRKKPPHAQGCSS